MYNTWYTTQNVLPLQNINHPTSLTMVLLLNRKLRIKKVNTLRKKLLRNREVTSKSANISSCCKITTQNGEELDCTFWFFLEPGCFFRPGLLPEEPIFSSCPLLSPKTQQSSATFLLLYSKTGLSASVSRHAALETGPSLSLTCPRIPSKREGAQTQIRENRKMNVEGVSRWKTQFCGYEENLFLVLWASNLIGPYWYK